MRRIEAGAAVLLAATRCPADRRLRDLPGAGAGLDAVRTGLAADPRGFSPGRIFVLDPTESAQRIAASIGSVAASTTGPMVVCLGGHLLADPRTHSLHLALAAARRETVRYTGLPLEWVTRALRGDGGRLAIVFLDVVWHVSAVEAVTRRHSRAAAELRPDGVLVVGPPIQSARAAFAAARRGRPTPFGRDLAAGLRVGVEGWLRVHAGSVAMPTPSAAAAADGFGPEPGEARSAIVGHAGAGQGRPAQVLTVAERGPLYRPRHALPVSLPSEPPAAVVPASRATQPPAERAAPAPATTGSASTDLSSTESTSVDPASLDTTPLRTAAAGGAPAVIPAQAPAESAPAMPTPAGLTPAGLTPAGPTPAGPAPAEPGAAEPAPAAAPSISPSVADRREQAHQAWLSGSRAQALSLLRALVADVAAGAPAEAEEAFGVRELLAHCVGEAGEPAEAAARFRDVCQDRLARFGPAHPASQQALDNFHVWWRRTPVSLGLPLASDLVKLRTEVNGAEHPATRAARDEAEEAAALVGGDPAPGPADVANGGAENGAENGGAADAQGDPVKGDGE